MPRRPLTAVALLLVASTAACGAQPAAPAAAPSEVAQLALVVGAHANGPATTLVPGVKTLISDTARAGGTVAVILNQGRPAVAGSTSFANRAANADAAKAQQGRSMAALGATLQQARATVPESNLLGAIDLAARSADGSASLVVVDNGLQTVAPLSFQDDGMLAAEPAEVADFLTDQGALPALTGRTVYLSGIGDTAAPQAALPPAQRSHLVEIWSTVLTRAGARVEVLDEPLTAAPATDLPPVTPVAVPEPASFAGTTTTVKLDSRQVAFVPDRAEFRDPRAVQDLLRPLARQIVDQRLAVALTGTTATAGTEKGRARLSAQRAEAVRRALVEFGVDPATVTAKGVGTAWPGHVQDLDDQGRLLPGPAARNRLVIVELRKR
jgi:OOP family OmpA-OmpF porin